MFSVTVPMCLSGEVSYNSFMQKWEYQINLGKSFVAMGNNYNTRQEAKEKCREAMCEYLKRNGAARQIPELFQMEEAEKFLKITLNNKRISRKKAKEILGDERYDNLLHRAAFHRMTGDETEQGYISFDCSAYFKERK